MRLSTRLMLAMVALVVLTAAAVGVLIHRNIEQRALPRALDRIDTRAHLLTLQLEAAVAGARADVSVQGQSIDGSSRAGMADDVDPATGTPSDVFKKRIASRFVAELSAKPEYSQFRIIGIADGGRELVRVDRMGPGGAIRAVPDAELQRKGDRDYFQAAIQAPGQRSTPRRSTSTANSGALEKPYVPTLRVAAPIVAGTATLRNHDRQSRHAAALDQLRNAGREGDLFAVNEHGDYLVHPDIRREFGFEFGTPFRIQDDFPEFDTLLGSDESAPRVIQRSRRQPFGVGWNTVKLAGGPRITVVEAVPYSQAARHQHRVAEHIGRAGRRGGRDAAGVLPGALAVAAAGADDACDRGVRARHHGALAGRCRRRDRRSRQVVHAHVGRDAHADRHSDARDRGPPADLRYVARPDRRARPGRQFRPGQPELGVILDYAPEELIGRNLAAFVHTQDIDATRTEMRDSRISKTTRNFETRFVHRSGRLVPLAWNGTWSEGAMQHFLIGRDMTEAKAAQEALRDSERIAEGIIAHSLDAIIQVNEWGEVIEWNPQAETMLGWSRRRRSANRSEPLPAEWLSAPLSRDEREAAPAADDRRPLRV